MSKDCKKKKGFSKFLTGVLVGAGLGVLFAPKKGNETRQELKEKIEEMLNKAKDVDIDEVKETIENKIEEIKEELEDLDKEKVKKIAVKKAEELKNKAEDLVEYAVSKGTPALEKTANSIREKVITITKEVLDKLENK